MDSYYIIVGLGNPGIKYDGTRHNVGYKVVDELTDRFKIDRLVRFGKSMIGKGVIGTEKVILVKPLTYMNLSGEAIREICSYYKVDHHDHLIVISDDVDLPVESDTPLVMDVQWRMALHESAVEHVLTKTALAEQSKAVYRAYAIEERPIDEVAAEFGLSKNYVSQIKTRVDRMVSAVEASYGE